MFDFIRRLFGDTNVPATVDKPEKKKPEPVHQSNFRFSKRSLNNLEDVDHSLQDVCHMALSLTEIDFAVIQGSRTIEEQRELVQKGASQTMNSKHLDGDAVDIMAYVGNRGSWESDLYCKIANAFRDAAKMENVKIRWGGAWHIDDIRNFNDDMKEAMEEYVTLRRSQGRKPFIDSGHFEINE